MVPHRPRTRSPVLTLLAGTALLALLLLAAPAQAQSHSCGDLQIVFKNPDLQPGSDGLVHAQGQFFAQFQAIGDEADDIAVFGFSFGPDNVPFDDSVCDQPLWFTGQTILNYRADRDASDGFFIPLVTPLVPDGDYTAAVHAYDANDNELARFWARAVVDNCEGGPGSYCRDAAAEHVGQDQTAPWPMVLPGDGVAMDGRHLSLEFGEELAEDGLRVRLNGEDITAELEAWEGREWDADVTPDYGPYGLGGTVAEPCTQPHHECMVYGPAFEWNGRPLTDQDVVRIEALDLAGNRAVKDIHIGSSVAGGAITANVPILSWSVDRTEQDTAPGQAAVFRFEVQNQGGATGHPFAEAEGPEGWTLEWQPAHVPVEPGEKVEQEFLVEVPSGTPPGLHKVNATMTYEAAGRTKELRQDLQVRVLGGPPANMTDEPEVDPAGKKSPAGAWVATALVLAAVARMRRSGGRWATVPSRRLS